MHPDLLTRPGHTRSGEMGFQMEACSLNRAATSMTPTDPGIAL